MRSLPTGQASPLFNLLDSSFAADDPGQRAGGYSSHPHYLGFSVSTYHKEGAIQRIFGGELFHEFFIL